jgi:hypothetical protein
MASPVASGRKLNPARVFLQLVGRLMSFDTRPDPASGLGGPAPLRAARTRPDLIDSPVSGIDANRQGVLKGLSTDEASPCGR